MAEGYILTDERWCWQRLTGSLPDASVRSVVVKYDAEDAYLVERYVWHLRPDHQTFYAGTNSTPRDENGWRGYMTMHALIMGVPARRRADADAAESRIAHLNGNGLDNRKVNLAWMTQQQILAKRRPPKQTGGRPTSSPYKGVCWDGDRQRWLAVFRGKKLGRFRDAQEAARAFDTASFAQWGSLAYLNFPEEQA